MRTGYTPGRSPLFQFHRKHHPKDMGHVEVAAFLSHLAVIGRVSASTQNQALCALIAGRSLTAQRVHA